MITSLLRFIAIPLALALFLLAAQMSGGLLWRADHHPAILAAR
jgi:hypothetical protein